MTQEPAVRDDTPLRLAVAAELAFPGGGITASGLRKEADKGRLVIERIAGKDYTTLRAIAEMRKLCRVAPKAQGSTSNQREKNVAKSSEPRPGSSATGRPSEGRELARAKLQGLRKRFENTSTKKPHRATATVTPIRSKSAQ